ncbi:MAG: TldD/PmbA family protein [Nitrososphaerales archaeon]
MSEVLLTKAERIVKIAEVKGAKQAQALVYSFDDAFSRFSRNTLNQSEVYEDQGVYLEIEKADKTYSSAFIRTVKEEELTKIIDMLLRQARLEERPPFTTSSNIQPINGTYDKKTAELTDKERAEAVRLAIQASLDYSKKITKASGTLTTRIAHVALANSFGISLIHSYTGCSLVCTPLAEDNSSLGVGFASQNTRSFSEINIEKIAEEASEDAVMSVNPKPIDLGRYDVIFQSDAAGDVIGSFVQLGFSTIREENYVEIGSLCSSELLTVSDEPRNLDTLLPRAFDAEGTQTANVVLIDKGVAKEMCFDLRLAAKANRKSSGHAVFPHDVTYSSKFFIGWVYYPFNQIVKAGNVTKQDMIREAERAILVKRLMYAGLPSGVCKKDVMQAHTMGTWLIEKGQIKHPLPSLRISASLKKLVKNIISVGDVNSVKKLGCINTPWLTIRDVLFTEMSSLSTPENVL